MKRLVALILMIVLLLSACEKVNIEEVQDKEVVRILSDLSQDDAGFRQLERFKKEVESASVGLIEVKLYAKDEWGSEKSIIDYTNLGMSEMYCLSTDNLSQYIADYQLYNYPNLFLNSLEVQNYALNEGKNAVNYVDNDKISGLGFVCNGYYYIEQNQAYVENIYNFNNMVLNGKSNEVFKYSLKLLGITLNDDYVVAQGSSHNLTEGDLKELLTKQSVNEASFLNNPNIFYGLEVCAYNNNWWNNLSIEQQNLISESFDKALVKECEYQNQQGLEWLAPLGGITYNEISTQTQSDIKNILFNVTVNYIIQSQNKLGEYFYSVPKVEGVEEDVDKQNIDDENIGG